MTLSVSVVVPTLNEASHIESCLSLVRRTFRGELVVVDGGSRDGTVRLAKPFATKILETSPGLAEQANAGAQAAKGDVLFFLSADGRVPDGWARAIAEAFVSPYVAAGGFQLHLDDERLRFRVLTLGGNFRALYNRMALPDQGLFVRRRVFEAVGGFRADSRIPYARFCLDSHALGEFVLRPERMRSSPRKYLEEGVVTTTLAHIRRFREFRDLEMKVR